MTPTTKIRQDTAKHFRNIRRILYNGGNFNKKGECMSLTRNAIGLAVLSILTGATCLAIAVRLFCLGVVMVKAVLHG